MKIELYYEPIRYFASVRQWAFLWHTFVYERYQKIYILRILGFHIVIKKLIE